MFVFQCLNKFFLNMMKCGKSVFFFKKQILFVSFVAFKFISWLLKIHQQILTKNIFLLVVIIEWIPIIYLSKNISLDLYSNEKKNEIYFVAFINWIKFMRIRFLYCRILTNAIKFIPFFSSMIRTIGIFVVINDS